MNREEALAALLDEWRAAMGPAADGFTLDGAIDEELWGAARPRVLFLSKEPNDRNGVLKACGHDLRRLFRDSGQYHQNRKTFEHRIGTWAYGIRYFAETGTIPSLAMAEANARDGLLASAVVNIKKTPGGGACKVPQLREHLRHYGHLLLRQIDRLGAEVVVGCGTLWPMQQVLGGMQPCGETGRCFERDGVLWVDQMHPSARGRSPEAMYRRAVDAYVCP